MTVPRSRCRGGARRATPCRRQLVRIHGRTMPTSFSRRAAAAERPSSANNRGTCCYSARCASAWADRVDHADHSRHPKVHWRRPSVRPSGGHFPHRPSRCRGSTYAAIAEALQSRLGVWRPDPHRGRRTGRVSLHRPGVAAAGMGRRCSMRALSGTRWTVVRPSSGARVVSLLAVTFADRSVRRSWTTPNGRSPRSSRSSMRSPELWRHWGLGRPPSRTQRRRVSSAAAVAGVFSVEDGLAAWSPRAAG